VGDLEGPVLQMENKELIQLLTKELAIEIAEQHSYNEVHAILAAYINSLIKNDFDKLISYLYRIDVNEQKLKSLMQQNPQKDTGDVIATLIIERQEQKIKTRKLFHKREDDIDVEEKW
jgi:N-acetylglucosamine kinase-like BadF-type ATPase